MKTKKIILTIICAVVLLAIAGGGVFYYLYNNTDRFNTYDFHAYYKNDVLVLENNKHYMQVDIVINGKYKLNHLLQTGYSELELKSFITNNGTRFNLETTRPIKIQINGAEHYVNTQIEEVIPYKFKYLQ